MQYRRAKTPGATYFFTVVTYQRQTIFDDAQMVDLLRQCFRVVKQRHPFVREHPIFAKVLGDFQEAVGELVEGQAPHPVSILKLLHLMRQENHRT